MRVFRLAAFVALMLVVCAMPTHAQQYQDPLGARCYNFDFGSNYGWDRYTNLCDEPIYIVLIFPRGGLFGIDLKPGKSNGTGHSKNEYASMGEPRVFVCPSGYRVVDMDDKNVSFNTGEYRCKR